MVTLEDPETGEFETMIELIVGATSLEMTKVIVATVLTEVTMQGIVADEPAPSFD